MTGHGGHAPYMTVPVTTLVPLPDELSFEEGAAISCGTGTAYQALRRLDVSGRDTLAVFGQGPVGLSATMLGVAMGARVVAVDVGPERRALGRELGAVREALRSGAFEELGEGRFRVAGHELGPDEVLVERAGKEGWAVAAEDGVTVALDTHVDEELDRERRVYELIRYVNTLRKESGLALSDRIELTIPERDSDLLEHGEWIKSETLAVSLEAGPAEAPTIANA